MLIEEKVDGRDALVAYLKSAEGGGFEPVPKDQAEVIKVIFLDNGERLFLAPDKDKPNG